MAYTRKDLDYKLTVNDRRVRHTLRAQNRIQTAKVEMTEQGAGICAGKVSGSITGFSNYRVRI